MKGVIRACDINNSSVQVYFCYKNQVPERYQRSEICGYICISVNIERYKPTKFYNTKSLAIPLLSTKGSKCKMYNANYGRVAAVAVFLCHERRCLVTQTRYITREIARDCLLNENANSFSK